MSQHCATICIVLYALLTLCTCNQFLVLLLPDLSQPLLLELVAETQPVVIISHLGVLRVIYGYLMGIEVCAALQFRAHYHIMHFA
jgi:hypothetical protein